MNLKIMACSKESPYCKAWIILPTVSIVGLVIYLCLNLELGLYVDSFRIPFTLNNNDTKYESNPEHAGCFQSPYVICNKEVYLKFARRPNATPPLVITTLVTHGRPYYETKSYDFGNCPLPCVFKPPSEIEEATGVIVDARFAKENHFPKTRHKNQIYLLTVMEPPVYLPGTALRANSKFKDQINLVRTYRVDSDIRQFYSRLFLNDSPKKTRKDLKEIYNKKTRSVAWFVSRCQSKSKRMSYVKELQKYIDVDIYGKCGNKSYPKLGSELRYLSDNYKFYLSFENSLCKDYVTEKFFRLFTKNTYVVSVVRGGTDYEKYFPPKTFINAGKFKSPLELAGFLKEVGDDFEKYIVYMEERDKYKIDSWWHRRRDRMCETCTAFHNFKNATTSRYEDIGSWLLRDNICHAPNMSWTQT